MSMSEEEIIEQFEHWIEYEKQHKDKINKADELIEIQQGLLDLYNKEKEKNKELEEIDLTTVYLDGFYNGEKKWKDKIRQKIKDREHIIHNSKLKYGKDFEIYEDTIISRDEITLLKELLEE